MFDHKKASFRTWMYRIASNKICDHYRSKVHRLSLKQEQIDMTDENLELHSGNLGTAVRDLSELIIHKELIEDIMEIVSLYKQEWQEIFYMKCFEERTFQDISQTLNISENTVKSRFYKNDTTNKKARWTISNEKKKIIRNFYVEQMDVHYPLQSEITE